MTKEELIKATALMEQLRSLTRALDMLHAGTTSFEIGFQGVSETIKSDDPDNLIIRDLISKRLIEQTAITEKELKELGIEI